VGETGLILAPVINLVQVTCMVEFFALCISTVDILIVFVMYIYISKELHTTSVAKMIVCRLTTKNVVVKYT
jgi:hypothetical protein